MGGFLFAFSPYREACDVISTYINVRSVEMRISSIWAKQPADAESRNTSSTVGWWLKVCLAARS